MDEDDDPNPHVFKSVESMGFVNEDAVEDEEDTVDYRDEDGAEARALGFFEEPDPDADLIDAGLVAEEIEVWGSQQFYGAHPVAGVPDYDAPGRTALRAANDAADPFDDDGVLDPEAMFAEMVEARTAEQAKQPPPIFLGIPGVKDYVFDGHAGAGPSGAERWMNCTMSLTASRRFLETLTPNQQREFARAGISARQGTTAHAVGEVEANFILGRVTAEEVQHTLVELAAMPEEEAEAYSPEMAEYVTEYTDIVKSYADERGSEHVLIESRVEAVIPLTGVHEGEFYAIAGSADLGVLPVVGKRVRKALRSLVVGDLKYGNGIDVDVDGNPQIRLYALGMLAELIDEDGNLPAGLEEIEYIIAQPRLGGVKTWSESVDDLLAWRDEELAPALTLALFGEDEGATYNPSELACQWCPARGGCAALAEQRIEQGAALFEAVQDAEFTDGPGALPDVGALSNERLGELLQQALGITKITGELKAEAQRRLHRAESVKGFQLVSYTPRRQWKDRAQEGLGELVGVWTEPVLMTPTQALAAVKGTEEEKVVERWVHAPDKRPVIAPEGDRRKPWTGAAPEAMFKNEEEA